MAEILLTQNKKVTVDECDFIELSKHKWCAGCFGGKWYAVRYSKNSNKNSNSHGKIVFMHRQIMNVKKGKQIDHRNGDGLDNKRENLRLSTQQQNVFNQKPTGHGTSKYKGVSWIKKVGKWYSSIKHNNKSKYLGIYNNEIDAAKAYDNAAKQLFGEFANVNFQ